jgi:hydrogenase maturation protease
MKKPRILVAGIGNVFLGDDGFGVVVAQALLERTLPDGVMVMDAGIRGIDLTYALMDGPDMAILIDATRRGREPGTLYVIEPETTTPTDEDPPTLLEAHSMDPARVLQFLRASGSGVGILRVLGCEPESFGTEEGGQLGLSATVRAAVAPAMTIVLGLIEDFLALRQASLTEGVHHA